MECQALKTHATTPCFTENLNSKKGPIPLSYSHTELGQILVSNASQPVLPKLTEIQHQLIRSVHEDRTYNVDEVHNILWRFYYILDNAFYCGLIKSQVELDIRTKFVGRDFDYQQGKLGSYTEWWADSAERGLRTPKRLCVDRGQKPTITLLLFHTPSVPDNKAPEKFTPAELRDWIGTLVHEMLHAFFAIYSCACWSKCHDAFQDVDRGLGFTGHGTLFCNTLHSIQSSCISEFGFQGIECGISHGIYFEMQFAGYMPSEDQIIQWKLNRRMMVLRRQKWEEIIRETGVDPRLHEKAKMQIWLAERRMAGQNKGWLGAVKGTAKSTFGFDCCVEE